jgi:SH3 domain-containing YSC84-like protein 1
MTPLIITVLGISVEGSIIAERQDANTLAYHSDVSVKGLLSGAVPRPDWAQPLYQTLDACTKFRGGQREWLDDSPAQEPEYPFNGLPGPGGEQQPRTLQKKKKSGPPPFPPASWGEQKPGGAYFNDHGNTSTSRDISTPAWDLANQDSKYATSNFETQFESDFNPQDDRFRQMHNRGFSLPNVPTPKPRDSFGSNKDSLYASDDDWPGAGISRANTYSTPYSPYHRSPNTARAPSMPIPELTHPTNSPVDSQLGGRIFDEPSPIATRPVITPKAELISPLTPEEGVGRAIALFDFNAVQVSNDPPVQIPSIYTVRIAVRRSLVL